MTLIHRVTLMALLGVMGISLVIPGLIEILRYTTGKSRLVAESVDAGNQLRALNGMMAGLGLVALWVMLDLQNSRMLVMALGVILVPVILARFYSMVVDGLPGLVTWLYLGVEILMAAVFLFWPPPY